MNENIVRKRYDLLKPFLNERTERVFVAAEAIAIGKGGISVVSHATGIERHRIGRGIKELQKKEHLDPRRIRMPGAGRKKLKDHDPTLVSDLERLVEPHSRGDPEKSLRWTTKSVRNLMKELNKHGHQISYMSVSTLLHKMKYSLQSNRKRNEGSTHPDRDAQFNYISNSVQKQLGAGNPVISVDAKKKELVGPFKNPGREWRPKGQPEEVRVHDFLIKELGKVCPYGVYDLAQNKGWVNVGIDHETAAFAVESIRQWWKRMGKKDYPKATALLITADAGGSNAARSRLWKKEIQQFANDLKLPITVCHFPPGTSKWNKIEHRLFSFISKNWRAKPLISHEVIVNLISSTTTKTGLKVECRIDKNTYPTKQKVTDQEMKSIQLKRHKFHGEWNYTISPHT